MRIYKHLAGLFILAAMIMLLCGQTMAAEVKTLVITNNTTKVASDLHIQFVGGGGTIFTVVRAQPPGCGKPAIPSNPPTATDELEIVWPIAAINPGDFVIVRISTPHGPLTFDSGYWTNPADPGGPNIGPVNAGDIAEIDEIPSMTTYGMIALVLFIAISGIIMARRRRVTA